MNPETGAREKAVIRGVFGTRSEGTFKIAVYKKKVLE